MDAQNAVEPASTKPAASPKRPGSDSDQTRSAVTARSSNAAKADAALKDGRPSASASNAHEEDGVADGNSDAETIVLPGKDGHSPSKVRKIIKREDKSDTEDAASVSRARKHESNGKQERDGDKGDRAEKKDKSVSVADGGPSDRAASIGAKKKLADKSKTKDGSSGLSSAPASPPQRRRRASNTHSKSDSETAQVESPKASSKEKPKSVDKLVPHKRKAPRPDSDDEAENRKVRRQRTSGSGLDASRKPHPPTKSHHDAHSSTRTRSVSPQPRAHRRSISTQLPGHSSNGLSHKKKRVPAPLQSTDYHSDESSASGSPHPRSSKLRSLATPATAESAVSPAKMAPHKKHLDAHGQTFLARACAKGEYETAKHRLQERPEDINVADYAGNTPLQIAALNGFDDIVKLLVDAGCNLDCVNNDKDTPLLDAVENGHLEVVRILLAAGVNPRKANAYGQEPIDRVTEDADNADEIRRALQDAKQRMGERRRTSEDHHLDQTDARSSHGPESPRRSPGPAGSIHAASGRRAGTVRSTKTSNHLLYMPMDDKTLRAAAARGDEETVTRILQVRETFDDPESMVAAARGGHEMVMQLLLALGRANPDPGPISNNEYSTPMLAAIGQENIKVIKLLLDQTDFDPTRRFKGETYHDIAKRRRGPNWMEEETMLKKAFDEHRKTHRGESKTKSPNRREQDRESRRGRAEPKDEPARSHKRKASSPTRESKRAGPVKVSTSPKEKRRSNSFTANPDDQTSPKRGPGRPKKEDRIPTIAISDREASPAGKQPTVKAKRAESDLAAASSEGETVKPRRKLVSGRELKGERVQVHRRASMTSNTSSLKEPSSPREESEKAQKTEKYHDRTKALKRDESRDRLSISGESSGKRHRSSATPPHLVSTEKDPGEGPVKRRRLNIEGKEKRLKPSSTDDRRLKAPAPRDLGSTIATGPRIRSKSRDDEERRPSTKPRKGDALAEHGRRESGKSVSSENSIHVKSEDPDVDMPDVDPSINDTSASRAAIIKEKEAVEKRKQVEAELQAREAKKKEEEKRRAEEEEREKEKESLRLEEEAKRRADEVRRREEEERKRKEEEEQRQKEEEERKQREQEERRQKEEEERRQREEEEKKRKEEEERKRKEELERKRKKEELERKRREDEEKRRKEDEERKRREEEERLRREQLEREAAEELRRKREEEERREQERKLQELERRRLAREAEQRRARLEQERIERIRLSKLPPLLRWLDGCINPKLPEVAERFRIIQGVRYDCIRPEATGTAEGREQWLLNTQVALLLGEKDLDLSRCEFALDLVQITGQ